MRTQPGLAVALISAALLFTSVPNVDALTGPVSSAPGTYSFADSGSNGTGQQGRSGGRVWTFSSFSSTAYQELYWGILPSTLYNTMNGSTTPNLAYSSGDSNLPNGVAIWNGTTSQSYYVSCGFPSFFCNASVPTRTVYVRLRLVVTDLSNNPLALTLGSSVGATGADVVLNVPLSGFKATLFMEAGASAGGSTPSIVYYENIGTSFTYPPNVPTAKTWADGRFWYEPNTAPVAGAQSVSFAEDSGGNSITLTATDAEGDTPLTYSIVTTTSGLTGTPPDMTYTPAADFNGNTSFTFKATDPYGAQSNTATVDIEITEVNDPPTAVDDSDTTAEDTALVFAASGLTADDSAGPANESGQTLTVTSVSASSVEGGTVTLVDGSITYTPAANFAGPDSFTYTVTDDGTTDGASDPKSDTGTVTIEVTGVGNDAPVTNDDTFSIAENSSNGTTVGTVDASDPDSGDTPAYAITAGNDSGTFAIDANTGEITVANSANLDFETSPLFTLTVTVTDDTEQTDTATITINVTDVFEAPPDSIAIMFDIYNQGRANALPSHVSAWVSDHESLEAHELGAGLDVAVAVELVSGPACEGEGCTPMLASGQSASYGAAIMAPPGGFGRHEMSGSTTQDPEDESFHLIATSTSASTVSFLYGRYFWVVADSATDLNGDKLDEAGQLVPPLLQNDAQRKLVGVTAPTFGQLTHLSATFQSLAGGSGDGTPRLVVHFGAQGSLAIRLGNPTAYSDTDASLNAYSGFNVIGNDDAGRYDTTGLTGVPVENRSAATTYTNAAALAGGFTITRIDFVADNAGAFPSREYRLDRITVSTGGGE